MPDSNNNRAWLSVNLIFLAVCLLLTVIIFLANHGHFSFVLDDPLIHLAMAENIAQGHYGINIGEFSSPSSSILWPFLLAVFTTLGLSVWPALLLNVLFCLLALQVFAGFLQRLAWPVDKTLLLFFLLWGNAFALVFIGMEHSLQLYLSVLILSGLWQVAAGQKPPLSLGFAIVLAPLVRYECLALSVPAILYLSASGYLRQALLQGLLMLLALAAFSCFLLSLGLEILPASVLLKSETGSASLTQKLLELITTAKAWFCFAAGFLLWRQVQKNSNKAHRLFAGSVLLMLLLFLAFGRFGWYYRYEIFIWVAVAMALLALYQTKLQAFYQQRKKFAVGVLVLLTSQHLLAGLLAPVSANNIYLQQMQMARFVKDYYPKPVAVNDIGWVNVANKHYVLDLWGLANKELRDLRLNSDNPSWMAVEAAKHDVGLAMIYSSAMGDANGWFEEVPESWHLLGHLTMQAMGVTVSKREVAFYATNEQAAKELTPLLFEFEKTLPVLTQFEWAE